jgi:hypothetical protein
MPSKKLKAAGVSKAKFDNCVSKVQAKGSGNAYAICTSSFNKHIAKKRMKK